MKKMISEELKFYLLNKQLDESLPKIDDLLKQNQIYLYTLFRSLSQEELDFLNVSIHNTQKIKDYLYEHHLTENQYYAKQRKILRKIERVDNGKCNI